MAQQMITLDEAAEILGISPEEMKKRLKTDPDFRRLSQIRDGSTVRFKLSAIEELARQLGQASDQSLPLAPMEGEEKPGSDDFKVPGASDKKKTKKTDDEPLDFGSSSEEDVFSLTDDAKPAKPPEPKSGGKLTPGPKSSTGKGMSDSSAAKGMSDSSAANLGRKGMSDSSTGSTDSDVKLDSGKKKPKPEEAGVPTEEIALDFSGPGSAVIKGGSSAKLSAPKAGGSSGKLAADASKNAPKPPADSSEFELSLDADSDDFELQMNQDSSEGGDEVDLGKMPKEKGTGPGSSGKKSSKSGINLRDPADSGISLEKKGKDGKDAKGAKETKDAKETTKKADSDSDSDVDFELSLDSSAVASSTKLGAPKSGKLVLDSDSDSEFELTLDDSSGSSLEQAALGGDVLEEPQDKGDIFETDFEIPPMPDESGSEAVPLESDTDLEKSDFELAMDDSDVSAAEEPSESEVVLLEDEEESAPAAKGKKEKPKPKSKGKKVAEPTDEGEVDLGDAEVQAEGDEDASASKVLKGVKGKKRRDDEEDEDEEAAPAGATVERPTKPWGIVPLIGLMPTALLVLLGVLMSYELLQTMWGYQQPRKPTAPLIRALASNLDMELRDQ